MKENRIAEIDALRGFALFGVTVSNLAVVAGAGAYQAAPTALDTAVGTLEFWFITGKFLALFSLLFGISFGLQLLPAQEGNPRKTGWYLDRMAVLFAIGLLHRILAGTDILMTYALLGCLLLVFRNASTRTLLVVGTLSLFVPLLHAEVERWLEYRPDPLIDPQLRRQLTAEGPYLQLVEMRAIGLQRWWRTFLQGFNIFALFALGFIVARKRWLHDVQMHRAVLSRILVGAVLLTVAGHFAQPPLRAALVGGGWWVSTAFGLVYQGTTFTQAIAYGAAFVLLMHGPAAGRRLALLAPAGRMALTNYLSVSLIGTLAFFGTGHYGDIRPIIASGLGVLLWILQVLWSSWWLRRHNTGPVELLWRRLSGMRVPG